MASLVRVSFELFAAMGIHLHLIKCICYNICQPNRRINKKRRAEKPRAHLRSQYAPDLRKDSAIDHCSRCGRVEVGLLFVHGNYYTTQKAFCQYLFQNFLKKYSKKLRITKNPYGKRGFRLSKFGLRHRFS